MMPLKILIAGLVLAASVIAEPAQRAAPLTLQPPGHAAGFPRTFFGMHVHLNPGQPERWPPPAIGSLRLWDGRVSWPHLEPQRGQWRFDRLDHYVDWASAHGVEVLLPLGLSPAWASARPEEPSAYGRQGAGWAAEPGQMEDWRRYVRTVATRYKGRIRIYELWNEVTDKGFFTGSLEALARLAQAAKEELAAVDSGIRLVAPSAVSLGARQTAWPADFMAAAGRGVVDIASFHLYHGAHAPELKLGMAPNVRRRLAERGFGETPLWNTETGYFIAPPPGLPPGNDGRYDITAQQAAQWLPRDMLLARAMGFERFFWFAWDNDYLGFLEPRTSQLRPQARVLEQFMALLTDSRLANCERDRSAVWRCALTLKDGSPALAVWLDPAGEAGQSIAVPWAGIRIALDGSGTRQPSGARIEPGPVVQLLVKSAG